MSSTAVATAPVKTAATVAVSKIEPPQEFLTELGGNKSQWQVMTQQFFPGANSLDTVLMVAKYCHAKGLDLMNKPFHIVPMYDTKKGGYVDTIWPSINYYDTQAMRTGEYAGKDATVFGPLKTFEFPGNVKIEAPEWATVTVYRIVKGIRCAFTSDEMHFSEFVNVVKGTGTKSGQPTDKWAKQPKNMMAVRARGSILRAAFPEVGTLPTAEEMEGGTIDDDTVTIKEQVKERAKQISQDSTPITGLQPTLERLRAASEEPHDVEVITDPPKSAGSAVETTAAQATTAPPVTNTSSAVTATSAPTVESTSTTAAPGTVQISGNVTPRTIETTTATLAPVEPTLSQIFEAAAQITAENGDLVKAAELKEIAQTIDKVTRQKMNVITIAGVKIGWNTGSIIEQSKAMFGGRAPLELTMTEANQLQAFLEANPKK